MRKKETINLSYFPLKSGLQEMYLTKLRSTYTKQIIMKLK